MTDQIAIPKLLDSFDVPVLLLENTRITFANDAALALLGRHVDGHDIRLAVRQPEAIALASSGVAGRVVLEGLSVPGSRWEMRSQPLGGDMRVVSFSDVSIAVSVARAHADFVANASHELRTPLAAIMGYVETLQDPKAGADAATRDRFLAIVGKEARRMQALVEDLMSLSRIEAVKHDLPTETIDLLAIAREVAGETMPKDKVAVTCNQDKALIAGDRGQIAQVLRNLVDNGLKYGKADGLVSVSIEVTQTGWILVNVHNEGDSIPPEHLPRLTERFYRADPARSRESGGTGLGLSIVKHIVERHRGRFDISSRNGDGVTATLMIPVAS